MTGDQLAAAFAAAGIDTAEKVQELLEKAQPALALPELDRRIEKARADQQAAFQTKEAEIQELQATQAALRKQWAGIS